MQRGARGWTRGRRRCRGREIAVLRRAAALPSARRLSRRARGGGESHRPDPPLSPVPVPFKQLTPFINNTQRLSFKL